MERTTMRGRICGTGSYIPEHYYDNNDLAKFVETNDEWIRERPELCADILQKKIQQSAWR